MGTCLIARGDSGWLVPRSDETYFFLKSAVPFTHILRTNTYHEAITATMKNPATAAA